MNSLLGRILILVPVLYLIAIVVMGQFHVTARETLRAAGRRTLRWLCWIAGLVVVMELIVVLFIGW